MAGARSTQAMCELQLLRLMLVLRALCSVDAYLGQ